MIAPKRSRIALWLAWVGCLALIITARSEVLISEFLAANRQVLADEDGEYADWIELYNPANVPMDLDGYYLTDTPSSLRRWRFPSVQIPAQGYLVVFASGKDRVAGGAPLHANFSLAVEGEYLALVLPDGVTVASEFTPAFPPQRDDVSYGLPPVGGGSPVYFSPPTPGKANDAGFAGFVADTKFSVDRGFFEAPFELEMVSATLQSQIRYTTNGTVPSPTNGFVYAGPVRITGTTVVRAAAYRDGYRPSNVDTHTYLFLDDVIRQSPAGQAPPGWPTSWGANTRDYGMDPDVVDSPAYRNTIKDDLKTLPSFSIVMNLKDLFDRTTGIYANPGQDGRTWERPCSVELIRPDGKDGFHINAGIRIRGGFSRSTSNPKHAFRLFFRSDYGTPKLQYPLFGDDGADRFDAVDLRTFQNYSWSFQADTRGIFLRDQFSRDTQLEMGHQSERGDFYHLYINGQYWGLFNTCERPEASFGETYYGGRKEDYDVLKVEAGSYAVNATDGDMGAWTRLYNLAKAGLSTDAAYERVQGNHPDGTRNPAYEVLVDVDNLIDYMLVIFYGGNLDAPISNFLGNTSPNNWYGIRNRTGEAGFRFFAHDAEHTLLDVNQNRLGPYAAGDSSVTKSSPQWVFQKLMAHPEFRLRVADRVHRAFFNDGLLTPAKARARLQRRITEIDRAVVAESARWGDAKRSTPLTRDVDWVREKDRVLNDYMGRRSDVVLGQLRVKGLYPALAAPSFSPAKGGVTVGTELSMTASGKLVYYTIDGTDPRLRGGTVAPSARLFQGRLPLTESQRVRARVQEGTNWSALNEAEFTLLEPLADLKLTEIMYHPSPDSDRDADDFEFLELKNTGSRELDLGGAWFTNGVRFAFPLGARVEAGGLVVLVSDPAAFAQRYPDVRVAGTYSGKLANDGEEIALVRADGQLVFRVAYGDREPWPASADGDGFSLVPRDATAAADPTQPSSWRASARSGGSPGQDDPMLNLPRVLITEVLTHTDPPALDAIELHNPGVEWADISGWYLTDDARRPAKFRIPEGTRIPAGGYLVLDESAFNAVPELTNRFTLSSHGEEVYLTSADLRGQWTGYRDGFVFGAAANGVSFGRYTNSVGRVLYPAQARTSLGAANAGPRLGAVVMNEVYYHPKAGDAEFIELRNLGDQSVALYDPAAPTNRWRINGFGFQFPAGYTLPPRGFVVVTSADPELFRQRYQVPSEVAVLGPATGSLQDGGERLELLRPDAPDVDTNGVVTVPWVVEDEVRYENRVPWPVQAAGFGSSLERVAPVQFGDDPASWRSSFGQPSPGVANDANRPPVVQAGGDLELETALFPAEAKVTATAVDDGAPVPPGRLSVAWTKVSGPGDVLFSPADQLTATVRFTAPGLYVLQVTADDGDRQGWDELTVVVRRRSTEAVLVARGQTWRYADDGVDRGNGWVASDFADASWKSGRAQLGYGDGDEVTVVGSGTDPSRKYTTTYFRHRFSVTGAATVTSAAVRLLRDDGAIVYLNGVEVFRSNMPEGSITAATFASETVSGDDETVNFYERSIDPSLLREGANVLAVEVHQVNLSSTDLSFDLELVAMLAPSNEAPQISAGSDVTVSLPAFALLKGVGTDDGMPTPPGRMAPSWSKVTGPGGVDFAAATSFETSAAFELPGTYVLRLSVADGELTVTDDVQVRVLDSFAAWSARQFTTSELQDPGMSGEKADPDGDGHTNEEEFVAGTFPKEAGSVLRFNRIEADDATASIILEFGVVAGRTYAVERRASLNEGAWLQVASLPEQGVSSVVRVTDVPDAGGNRYYRLLVSAP